ncbi:hypothetical protein TeGR_g1634, partial [Tetraparma gracilis]
MSNPPWLRTLETIVTVQNSTSMKVGSVGAPMRSTQPSTGSDANPTPAFHKDKYSAKTHDYSKEANESSFQAWKSTKTLVRSEPVSPPSAPQAMSSSATEELIKQRHKEYLRKKNEQKKKDAAEWDRMTAEREALIARKTALLQPHIERKKELLRLERKKFREVTSGKALP